jgi:hypothetical protein
MFSCLGFKCSNEENNIINDLELNTVKYYIKEYSLALLNEKVYNEYLKKYSLEYFSCIILYYNYRGDIIKYENPETGFIMLFSYSHNKLDNTIIRTDIGFPESTTILYLDINVNTVKREQYEDNELFCYYNYKYNEDNNLTETIDILGNLIFENTKYEYCDNKIIRKLVYRCGDLVEIWTPLLYDNKGRIIREKGDDYFIKYSDNEEGPFKINIYEYFDIE